MPLFALVYVRLKSAAATLFEGFFQRPTLELSQESRPLPMAACAQTASHACAAESGENTFAENLIRRMNSQANALDSPEAFERSLPHRLLGEALVRNNEHPRELACSLVCHPDHSHIQHLDLSFGFLW